MTVLIWLILRSFCIENEKGFSKYNLAVFFSIRLVIKSLFPTRGCEIIEKLPLSLRKGYGNFMNEGQQIIFC